MIEIETKNALNEQEFCRTFQETECLKQIAINLARIVDRLDEIERAIWINAHE